MHGGYGMGGGWLGFWVVSLWWLWYEWWVFGGCSMGGGFLMGD